MSPRPRSRRWAAINSAPWPPSVGPRGSIECGGYSPFVGIKSPRAWWWKARYSVTRLLRNQTFRGLPIAPDSFALLPSLLQKRTEQINRDRQEGGRVVLAGN